MCKAFVLKLQEYYLVVCLFHLMQRCVSVSQSRKWPKYLGCTWGQSFHSPTLCFSGDLDTCLSTCLHGFLCPNSLVATLLYLKPLYQKWLFFPFDTTALSAELSPVHCEKSWVSHTNLSTLPLHPLLSASLPNHILLFTNKKHSHSHWMPCRHLCTLQMYNFL